MAKKATLIKELIGQALSIYEDSDYDECFKNKNGKLVVEIDKFKEFFNIPNQKEYKPGIDALPDSLYVKINKQYNKLIRILEAVNEEYKTSLEEAKSSGDTRFTECMYSSIFVTHIIKFNDNLNGFFQDMIDAFEVDSIDELLMQEVDMRYSDLKSADSMEVYNGFIRELLDISKYTEDEFDDEDEGQYLTEVNVFEKYDLFEVIDIIDLSSDFVSEILELVIGEDCDELLFEYEQKIEEAIRRTIEYIVTNNI